MCDGKVTHCCYFLFLFRSDHQNDVRDDSGLVDRPWKGEGCVDFFPPRKGETIIDAFYISTNLFGFKCFSFGVCCLEIYFKCFGTQMLLGVAS